MKLGKMIFAASLVLVVLPGCSSDDSDKAKQQCEDLTTRFCTSAIDCQVSGGLIEASEKPSQLATCKSGASDSAECSKAVGVSSNYDACMSKLANPPCDDVNQAITDGTLGLPSECNGVILIRN